MCSSQLDIVKQTIQDKFKYEQTNNIRKCKFIVLCMYHNKTHRGSIKWSVNFN